MNINWFGQSFFEVSFKGSDGEVKIVLDPFSEKSGLKMPKIEPQVILCGGRLTESCTLKSQLITVDTPGEYEIKGIFIKGIMAEGADKASVVIYTIEGEGLKLAHLSRIGQKELLPEQIEEIGEVDVLLVPVGGEGVADAKAAAEMVSQIEPKIVIPMHFAGGGQEGVDKFLKIMGVENIAPQKKVKITAKDLPKEDTQIIVLEP